MKKLLLLLLPLCFSASLEAKEVQKSADQQYIKAGPRKNYRKRLAQNYFGKGSRCHKWNRFCGR